MPYIKYSDKEIKEILKNIVILCDSREQQNQHIIKYFDSKKINHQTCKLDSGDYSVLLPAMEEYGLSQPTFFDDSIVIERKASLEELSGNLTKDRSRIENEFTRLKQAGTKTFLLVENPVGYHAIWQHAYKTQYDSKAFMASLLAFQQRHGLNITFLGQEYSGLYIGNLMYYHVRQYLQGNK